MGTIDEAIKAERKLKASLSKEQLVLWEKWQELMGNITL